MKPAILIILAALFSTPVRAQTCAGPTHLGVPGLASIPSGVSADGRVVVGSGLGGPVAFELVAFRWTADGGTQDLGSLGGNRALAYGVNADGSVVVGESETAFNSFYHAYRWTAPGGMTDLGTLGGVYSAGGGVSADGSVVVGWSDLPNGLYHAFRWTAAGGMQDLGTIPGDDDSFASAVSADGSVVVGTSGSLDYTAFRWTAAGGMQGLGTLGGNFSSAHGVSADGSVVVGWSGPFASRRAFRWTAAGGMEDLGTLGGPSISRATGVSADGNVIVGFNTENQPVGAPVTRAFRWTAASGMRALQQVGVSAYSASGVSADGSIVVGSAARVNGEQFAFRLQSSILGTTYCRPSVENSTGCGGIVLASGDPHLATGALDLTATLLPVNTFGFFLTSQVLDLVVAAGGSQGNLCLGGNIGRFDGPGQVMDSGATGSFTLTVDLNAVPTPTGFVAVQAGETWNFQAWHRDANPGPTSNFTDAVSVTFL